MLNITVSKCLPFWKSDDFALVLIDELPVHREAISEEIADYIMGFCNPEGMKYKFIYNEFSDFSCHVLLHLDFSLQERPSEIMPGKGEIKVSLEIDRKTGDTEIELSHWKDNTDYSEEEIPDEE